jgi:putative transposase
LAQSQGRYLGYNPLAKQSPVLKTCEDTGWLKEAHAQVLQQSLKNLDRPFRHFFDKHGEYAHFKRKRARQSVCYPQTKEKWLAADGRHIYLPKVGHVRRIIYVYISRFVYKALNFLSRG